MKRSLFLFVFLSLLLLITSTSGFAAIVMTPYLQAVTADSIYVLVECDSKDTVTVKYGTNITYGRAAVTENFRPTTASPFTYVHRVKLTGFSQSFRTGFSRASGFSPSFRIRRPLGQSFRTGLQADTLYHYKVFQKDSTSGDFTFRTAVSPGTKFRFAWMADCRQGTDIHDKISKRIKNQKPRFLLYGGDLCSLSKYENFKHEFFRDDELSLISRVPFFNAVGNHEGWSQNTRAFSQAPESSSGTQAYYSFDYGDLHVLVLNTEIYRVPESEQYKFAQKDLKDTDKPWKIVIYHKPAYSGGIREDAHMKTMTTNIFEPYGVDMTIAAHGHYYQHNIVNGIHHMIIGSAGAPLYWPRNARYTKKSVRDYNYAIVDVAPTSLKMKVYNADALELDVINLIKK